MHFTKSISVTQKGANYTNTVFGYLRRWGKIKMTYLNNFILMPIADPHSKGPRGNRSLV